MATWGEFIAEMKVSRMQGAMWVKCDQVLDLFDERNRLRQEIKELKQTQDQPAEAVPAEAAADPDVRAREREVCAQELEEFARVWEEESGQADYVQILRAAADMLRKQGAMQTDETPGEGTEIVQGELVEEPTEPEEPI